MSKYADKLAKRATKAALKASTRLAVNGIKASVKAIGVVGSAVAGTAVAAALALPAEYPQATAPKPVSPAYDFYAKALAKAAIDGIINPQEASELSAIWKHYGFTAKDSQPLNELACYYIVELGRDHHEGFTDEDVQAIYNACAVIGTDPMRMQWLAEYVALGKLLNRIYRDGFSTIPSSSLLKPVRKDEAPWFQTYCRRTQVRTMEASGNVKTVTKDGILILTDRSLVFHGDDGSILRTKWKDMVVEGLTIQVGQKPDIYRFDFPHPVWDHILEVWDEKIFENPPS